MTMNTELDVRVVVYIDEEMNQVIEEECLDYNMTKSRFFREAARERLERELENQAQNLDKVDGSGSSETRDEETQPVN